MSCSGSELKLAEYDNAKSSMSPASMSDRRIGVFPQTSASWLPARYGQVDHPMPGSPGEAAQRGKQLVVVGAGDRGGHSLLTVPGVPHAGQVEEVSGQHELDRPPVVVQVLQQRRELRGGLEDLAARLPADVDV